MPKTKQPKKINHFPSQEVDEYLKKHGHLPNAKCDLSLCREHECLQCAICKNEHFPPLPMPKTNTAGQPIQEKTLCNCKSTAGCEHCNPMIKQMPGAGDGIPDSGGGSIHNTTLLSDLDHLPDVRKAIQPDWEQRFRGKFPEGEMKEISTAIKKRRLFLKFTQLELATLSGVNYATVRKIETGAVKNPSFKTVMKLCMAINLDIWELAKILGIKFNSK